MFISEFLDDANVSLVFLTMLVCLRVNYITKIDSFTIWDGDRLIGFKSIL